MDFVSAALFLSAGSFALSAITYSQNLPKRKRLRLGALAVIPEENLTSLEARLSQNQNKFAQNTTISTALIDGITWGFGYFESIEDQKVTADKAFGPLINIAATPHPRASKMGTTWLQIEQVFYTEGATNIRQAKGMTPRRCVSVTGLDLEREHHYRTLHQTTWPAVLDIIKKANIRHYSIYLADIGDKLFLFSYFEYVGENFEKDMAMIGNVDTDPTTRRWWQQTDWCQIPLPEAQSAGKIWHDLQEIAHRE